MRKEDARDLIISEWRRWKQVNAPNKHATGTDGFIFFGFLQREKPALLAFRSGGDKLADRARVATACRARI